MPPESPEIFVGTAGWSYKDWVPGFYPKSQSKNFDWLEYYAQFFNVVEVNATYYAYLNPASARGWLDKVSDNPKFRFTVKLHQDFTHGRRFEKENVRASRELLEILQQGERLGGILIQFPYSFACTEPALEHVRLLNETFKDYVQFVELRHSSWANPQAHAILQALDMPLCTIDQPQIGRSLPFEPVLTGDKGYFRFHGRNVAEWKKSIASYGKKLSYEEQSERYKYLYSPGELTEIEQKIKAVYDSVKEVYVIMNNHPGSYGIVNAFELLYMLGQKNRIPIPPHTVEAFPRLQKLARTG